MWARFSLLPDCQHEFGVRKNGKEETRNLAVFFEINAKEGG